MNLERGNLTMSVGENILNLRKEKGLSQESLAEKMCVSRQTISQWEKDQTLPTVDNLLRLKEIFDVSVDKVLNENGIVDTDMNANSIDTVCAALCYAAGVKPPKFASEKNYELANYIDKVFDGEKADRILMYNPDAIGEWIYRKYIDYLAHTVKNTDIEIPLASAMPSVTPVNFASMYTGAQPHMHGIQKYERPVLSVETIFDAFIKAGKRCAIVASKKCSVGMIFLERDMDYYLYENSVDGNAKAVELILRDEYDLLVVYNGNYDSVMHKNGPESAKALSELRVNDTMFSIISKLVKEHWKNHNTLVGFAMDHGCHEIDGDCGSHGLYTAEDINIVHRYKGYKREN